MPVPLRLAQFTPDTESHAVRSMTPEDIADLELLAYEKGYHSGWEDAQAQVDAQARLDREIVSRTIEQINFTYQEARAAVEQALAPVLQAIATGILPRTAQHALVPFVIEALQPLIEDAQRSGLSLRVPQGQKPLFEVAFSGLVLPPLTLVEDAGLPEGTAHICNGPTRLEIDPLGVAQSIAAALDRHFQLPPTPSPALSDPQPFAAQPPETLVQTPDPYASAPRFSPDIAADPEPTPLTPDTPALNDKDRRHA